VTSSETDVARVARWYISAPKILIEVCFGGPLNGWKMLVYFMAIWYVLRPFGKLYSHMVFLWSFNIFMYVCSFWDVEKSGNLGHVV
jgi:hypothetical protein